MMTVARGMYERMCFRYEPPFTAYLTVSIFTSSAEEGRRGKGLDALAGALSGFPLI